MNKLLSANFMRLKKDKVFWAELLLMLGLGIFFPVKRYQDAVEMNTVYSMDIGFFACALFIGVFMAVFCSRFIGTEYSDGTIRNKIIVGQKRSAIYLANIIVSSVAGLILCATFFLTYFLVGAPLLNPFAADGRLILLTVLTTLLLTVAFTSLFTFVGMLCQYKATTAIICILLAFGLLLGGILLNQMLEAPKTLPFYSMDENGEFVFSEEPNPRYLEGTKREIVQTIYDILPSGQALQCAILEAVNLPRLPFYSLAITLLATGGGILLFGKKDLR